jgi:hypothetical protein
MRQDAKSLSSGETAARFLVEFDSACSLFRLYGQEHPAFHRRCEAAATSLDQPLNLSVSPRGFSQTSEPLPTNADLERLAQRLRSLGLVGLEIQGQLTAKYVESLVLALNEAERKSRTGDAVASSISAATDNRVQALPLKLDGLRLVEGTFDPSAETDAKAVWEPLFAQNAIAPSTRELAQSFERSLRGTQSSAHWKAMVDVWLRELSAVEKPVAAEASKEAAPGKLDVVASFLQQLSPPMCQRLLTETISHDSPDQLVLSLAERLPTGTLLGALSSVSRTSGGPSAAALALLRRCSTQVTGTAEQAPEPVTNEQLAEAADTLSKLLGSDHEGTFVPTEYLQRREQLSRPAAESASAEAFVTWPDERQTMSHAAQLTFDILSTPNASVKHLTASLEYVKNRLNTWVRSGEFVLAGEGIKLAQVLALHEDPAVAKPAQTLFATSVSFEDLLAGARSAPDRQQAVDQIAELLGQAQGAVLAGALANATSAQINACTPTVTAAIARAFPKLSQQSLAMLFPSGKDTLPQSLLSILGAMVEADALHAAQILLSAAPAAARLPLVELMFRGKHPWPVPLIEHLLKDNDRTVRRLAAMRLVHDAGLATAASVLHATGMGQFEPDVGVFLAELLHQHRRDPSVRGAYRQWWWSTRRWGALFSWRAEGRRQAG